MPYKDPQKQREAIQRSKAKRQAAKAAEEFGIDDLPPEPTTDQLLRLLGKRARQGNVPAIKLLLERPWEKKNDDSGPTQAKSPLAGVDELAARRAA